MSKYIGVCYDKEGNKKQIQIVASCLHDAEAEMMHYCRSRKLEYDKVEYKK